MSLPGQTAAVVSVTGRPVVRRLGMVDYAIAQQAMRRHTAARTALDADEIWLLQHRPVYTRGQRLRGGAATIGGVPVIESDRGGLMTYHGPGQWIAYVLLDLRRRGVGVRWLVSALEQAVIDLLAGYTIAAAGKAGAPGVYVNGRKVAALGLRVRDGCSYHGLSLNVDLDLAPFTRIAPCGASGLAVTRLRDLGVADSMEQVGERLLQCLCDSLGYTRVPGAITPPQQERS